MECGIEYQNHRDFRHYLSARFYACDIGRIMNRSQFSVCFTCRDYFVAYENRRSEILAAVYHSVAHCADFTEILDTADLRIGDRSDDLLDASRMICKGQIYRRLFGTGLRISECGSIS